jgi:hypothetical protein
MDHYDGPLKLKKPFWLPDGSVRKIHRITEEGGDVNVFLVCARLDDFFRKNPNTMDEIFYYGQFNQDGIHLRKITKYELLAGTVSNKYIKLTFMYNNSSRCFISNCAMLYTSSYSIARKKCSFNSNIVWVAEREHLLPIRDYGDDTIRAKSIVIVGSYLNKKMGHNPLSIKLSLKRYLLDKEYPKDDPLNEQESLKTVMDYKIEHEKKYLFHNKFIYQPHTYTNVKHTAAAQEFTDRLLKLDYEFVNDLECKWYEVDYRTVQLPIDVIPF